MIDRLPPPQTFAEFWERARNLCSLHHGSITSGMRSHKRNADVGGRATSYHRIARGGIAADVVLDDMSAEARARFCEAGTQLGLDTVDEVNHIHLEPADS